MVAGVVGWGLVDAAIQAWGCWRSWLSMWLSCDNVAFVLAA